jgi:hypothetical protein
MTIPQKTQAIVTSQLMLPGKGMCLLFSRAGNTELVPKDIDILNTVSKRVTTTHWVLYSLSDFGSPVLILFLSIGTRLKNFFVPVELRFGPK